MIVHESIKQLLNKVHLLSQRCEALEVSNDELKDHVAELRRVSVKEASHFPANGNLTGYASSEGSADGKPTYTSCTFRVWTDI